jgi:hypothetical protein
MSDVVLDAKVFERRIKKIFTLWEVCIRSFAQFPCDDYADVHPSNPQQISKTSGA